jgi:hypothetical protein
MKDFGGLIFIGIIVVSFIFEKIAKAKKAQESRQRNLSPSANSSHESAEQFFQKLKLKKEAPQQSPNKLSSENNIQEKSDRKPLKKSLRPLQPTVNISTKKNKIDFKDKNAVKKAIIMKTLLDSPQAYKY